VRADAPLTGGEAFVGDGVTRAFGQRRTGGRERRPTAPESHPLSLGVSLHTVSVQKWLSGRGVGLAVGPEPADSYFGPWPPASRGTLVRADPDPDQTHSGAPTNIALVGAPAPPEGLISDMRPHARVRRDTPGGAPYAPSDTSYVPGGPGVATKVRAALVGRRPRVMTRARADTGPDRGPPLAHSRLRAPAPRTAFPRHGNAPLPSP
jgi:hypothetical protein